MRCQKNCLVKTDSLKLFHVQAFCFFWREWQESPGHQYEGTGTAEVLRTQQRDCLMKRQNDLSASAELCDIHWEIDSTPCFFSRSNKTLWSKIHVQVAILLIRWQMLEVEDKKLQRSKEAGWKMTGEHVGVKVAKWGVFSKLCYRI